MILDKIKNFLDRSIHIGSTELQVWDVLTFVIILLVTWAVVFLVEKFALNPLFKKRKLSRGREFALKKIVKYSIYTVGIIIVLTSLGAKSTSIIPAALLVGVGIGLQQTFNDVFSGLILLFEDSVNVGDVVEVEGGMVGKMEEIGVRNSKIKTRENISVILPNSKIIVNNVINWSHQSTTSMFRIKVGVAYGSEIEMVEKLLLESANENKDVKPTPEPRVIFSDFGNSSLDFQLFFASDKLMEIEFVKSDLRMAIDRKFRENKVVIPFPQRDLHIKSGNLSN